VPNPERDVHTRTRARRSFASIVRVDRVERVAVWPYTNRATVGRAPNLRVTHVRSDVEKSTHADSSVMYVPGTHTPHPRIPPIGRRSVDRERREPEPAHASMDFKIHRPRAWVNAHVAIDRDCIRYRVDDIRRRTTTTTTDDGWRRPHRSRSPPWTPYARNARVRCAWCGTVRPRRRIISRASAWCVRATFDDSMIR